MIKKLNVKKISSLFYFIGYLHIALTWVDISWKGDYERLLSASVTLDGILVNQPNVRYSAGETSFRNRSNSKDFVCPVE